MKAVKWLLMLLSVCILCACEKENENSGEPFAEDTGEITSTEATISEEEAAEQWEKGYGLPVDEQEEAEAENDCREMMELVFDIYEDADKGMVSEVILEDKTVLEMQKR